MPTTPLSGHRDISHHTKPQSSRDLSIYTVQELDQIRKSNATTRLTKFEAFKLFLWNPEQKTVFHWTKQTWLFVVIFYPIFIGLFVALFFGMMTAIIAGMKQAYVHRPMINKRTLLEPPNYKEILR